MQWISQLSGLWLAFQLSPNGEIPFEFCGDLPWFWFTSQSVGFMWSDLHHIGIYMFLSNYTGKWSSKWKKQRFRFVCETSWSPRSVAKDLGLYFFLPDLKSGDWRSRDAQMPRWEMCVAWMEQLVADFKSQLLEAPRRETFVIPQQLLWTKPCKPLLYLSRPQTYWRSNLSVEVCACGLRSQQPLPQTEHQWKALAKELQTCLNRMDLLRLAPTLVTSSWKVQGLVNVPIEHHPTIGDIISNRYLSWWCETTS